MSQYTSYWLYQKYEKRGDQDWIPTYPNEYSVDANGTLTPVTKLDNDTACGYSPTPTTQYRWVDLNPNVDYYCEDCPVDPSVKIYRWNKAPVSDYVCDTTTHTKYYKEYYQYSTDGGVTWENVVPEQSRTSSDVIEYDSTDCGYEPTPTTIYRWVKTNYTICVQTQYFTIVAKSSGVVKKTNHSSIYYYSKNNNIWLSGNSSTSISVSSGDKVRFKGPITPDYSIPTGVGTFSGTTCTFEAEGNIMSLLYGDDFSGKKSLTSVCGYDFYNLFKNCTGLTSINNLILPATELTNYCYDSMFDGCTSLTSIPSGLLPATTLAGNCYETMFIGCTSLTSIPSGLLPATTLTVNCYHAMFAACTSLTSIPSGLLPATTLAFACYHAMFDGCTSLTNIPSDLLPATKLAPQCYDVMFAGCTSLTSIPSDLLPATTLAYQCYGGMFYGCRNLIEAPNLPALKLFSGSIPRSGSYDGMFMGCVNLNRVTCLATNAAEGNYTTAWLMDVSPTGIFTKKAGAVWRSGEDGIPDDWTVVEI